MPSTSDQAAWLLPEGVTEAFPELAGHLEYLRRNLLDLYRSWGYAMVRPPLVEYAETLLTAMGKDLEERTFKVVDPLDGRLLGIRADMTPQIARIDAHHLRQDIPTRLCYVGTVLRAKPEGPGGPRALIQIGAELFGHSGVQADIEIILLMLQTLSQAGIDGIHLDLGHVGIFRALVRQAGLDSEQEHRLFDAMQRKAGAEIHDFLQSLSLDSRNTQMLTDLLQLNGSVDILAKARQCLGPAGAVVQQALDDLEQVADRLATCPSQQPLHFDLAELRGYHYHTGLVFAAFRAGSGQEIARGGRYDNIGQDFGRANAATGFSADLNTLIALIADDQWPLTDSPIYAPCQEDPTLWAAVMDLRQQGEQVIYQLPGQAAATGRIMQLEEGQWRVVTTSPLSTGETPKRTGTCK